MSASKTAGDYLLGVERSILGSAWRKRLDVAGEGSALALSQAHGVNDVLARLLAARGVGIADALSYLNPTLRELMPDPLVVQDMAAAANRLGAAIISAEKIAVFGDYDVDGACSAALMITYLRAVGAPEPLLHIPDRIFEGYGPNREAIEQLAHKGATLLVTVDCGTVSHEAFKVAKDLGLDVIVFDHHQASDVLPDAIVVNPNRQDDISGLGALCAAGVVFLALIAISRVLRAHSWWQDDRPAPDLLEALDLVALATVADVAPLTGLNRAFVLQGLKIIGARQRLGLATLMDVSKLEGPVQSSHLGFALGPRINAGGRIGDASLGCRLLMQTIPQEAEKIALELERLNGERRIIEQQSVEEAIVLAEEALRRSNKLSCLIVQNENWHPGVVGLIASRLKERFKIPSFAFVFNRNSWTGSGRSITGVDLGKAVKKALDAGLALKGGGHAMAASITIAPDQFNDFCHFMTQSLADHVDLVSEQNVLFADGLLSGRGVNKELLASLALAGPFGQSNPEPVFILPSQKIADIGIVGGSHVRVRLRSQDNATIDAIAFRSVDTLLGETLLRGQGKIFHIAARVSQNYFRGSIRPQTTIIDLASDT